MDNEIGVSEFPQTMMTLFGHSQDPILLCATRVFISQEACWTLSNVVAGTPAQMALVCDTPGVLGGVIELLSNDVWEVQKEANFVISNIATANKSEPALMVNFMG